MTRILVIDDDVVSRVVVRHVLGVDGHEIVEEADGLGGAGRLESESFDLVLCDQEMPGMTGLELRRSVGTKFSTPFVLLTGYADVGELETVDAPSMELIDAFLTKPVSSNELRDVVNRLLLEGSASNSEPIART